MSAAQYISYADLFENIEAVIMAIWIGGTFIKLGVNTLHSCPEYRPIDESL